MFADDACDGVQAQTSPLADLFRSEEWFEDARPRGSRYSRTIVANLNQNISRFALGAYLQFTAFAHRIDRVNNQVGPNLIELTAISLNLRQRLSILARDGDVFL